MSSLWFRQNSAFDITPPKSSLVTAMVARVFFHLVIISFYHFLVTYEQALNRAASLCSQGEKCSSDIFDKATSWGLAEEDAARLVARLIEERFIDDERFAHAFVNDKFVYQHWGRVKIRYALRQKGIEDSVISQMLEEVVDEELYLEACVDALRPKARGMEQPLSPNDRARLFRFAAQRGFEPDIISKAISEISNL